MATDKVQSNVFRRNNWRLVIAVESAVAGAIVAFAVAWMLELDETKHAPNISPYFAAVLGSLGGAVGGLILSGGYGHPDRKGWLYSALCSILAPSLAGGIAGTCLLPGPGTFFGAYLPLWTFYYPLSLSLWTIFFVLIHLHARRIRKRDFELEHPQLQRKATWTSAPLARSTSETLPDDNMNAL
jgi:hypothetical protein